MKTREELPGRIERKRDMPARLGKLGLTGDTGSTRADQRSRYWVLGSHVHSQVHPCWCLAGTTTEYS